MKVTIDSAEPLAGVLRVLGSLYDVTLITADDIAPPGKAERSSKPPSKRASRARSATTTDRRTRSTGAASDVDSVDPKLVRRWAWENGHDVNTRGSLPAAIREAYRAANPT